MPVNAFMKFSNASQGESKQKGFLGKDGWFEIQGWDWEIEAESSWTKGSGASVGKPNPGKMNFEHYFDKSSTAIMQFICKGMSFDAAELNMCKTTGGSIPEQYFRMVMKNTYITKVSNSGTEEGNVTQKIECVFKEVFIEYKPQLDTGKLDSAMKYHWNIPEGSVE
ncbi:MAG TPA: type VI secretion system tube protein Hcp [Caldimonas sp.]|nr:type VI secretion system tube protein Hcp [Caldimonas sp.]